MFSVIHSHRCGYTVAVSTDWSLFQRYAGQSVAIPQPIVLSQNVTDPQTQTNHSVAAGNSLKQLTSFSWEYSYYAIIFSTMMFSTLRTLITILSSFGNILLIFINTGKLLMKLTPCASVRSNLTAFCENRKSFRRYNGFVQNFTTVTKIHQGLCNSFTLNSVQVCTCQYNMFRLSFYGTHCIEKVQFARKYKVHKSISISI